MLNSYVELPEGNYLPICFMYAIFTNACPPNKPVLWVLVSGFVMLGTMVYDTFMILITYDSSNVTINNYGLSIFLTYLETIVNWAYVYQFV